MVFLKIRPFVKRNNAEFTNVSSFTSLLVYSTHFTLSCRILLFSPPHHHKFFQVFVFWNHQKVCLVDSVYTPFSSNWMSLELDSIRFWTSNIHELPTSCRKFLYFTLYLVYCTQKVHWRAHSLADIVPTFLTILQFSSELSNNWDTDLPCLCPSSI